MTTTAPTQTKTWLHAFKGLITGEILRDDDGVWLHVRLTADHALKSARQGRGPFEVAAGTVMVLRKSRLTDITAEYDARVEQIARLAMNPPKQTVGPFSYTPNPRKTSN